MSLDSVASTNHPLKEADEGDSSDYRDSSSTSELTTRPSSVASANKDVPSEASIAEGAFHSERSRVLFDAIDQFQSCGAGAFMEIPQV